MSEKFRKFLRRTPLIVVRAISFIFCFTLGCLALYIFSIAATYFANAVHVERPEALANLFTTIGLIAVAAAVLDLSVTLYREMVAAEGEKRRPERVRESLTRFVVIVIIAVLIERLILFFKYSESENISRLPYAALAFVAAFFLMIGLGLYIKISIAAENLASRKKDERDD